MPDKDKEIRQFVLTLTRDMGLNRAGGRGGFIDSVMAATKTFYAEVLQNLTAWKAKPAKLPTERPPSDDIRDLPDVIEFGRRRRPRGSIVGPRLAHGLRRRRQAPFSCARQTLNNSVLSSPFKVVVAGLAFLRAEIRTPMRSTRLFVSSEVAQRSLPTSGHANSGVHREFQRRKHAPGGSSERSDQES